MFVTIIGTSTKQLERGMFKMTDTNKNNNQNNNQDKGLTDEQLEKIIQSETDKVRTKYSKEIKDMQDKIKEYEDKHKEYEQKEKYYKTVDALEENNIPSQLAKWIDIDIDSEEEIEELKKVFEQSKIDTGYKPEQTRTEDSYAKAEKQGDVQGMLSNKLGRLFD